MWTIFLFLSVFIHFTIGKITVEVANSPSGRYPISAIYDRQTKKVCYADYGVAMCNAKQPCLLCYDTIQNVTYTAYIKGQSLPSPTFLIPAKGPSADLTQFVAGFGKTVYLIQWDGCSSSAKILKILFTLDKKNKSTRLGVGHRDESGKVLYASNINLRLCGAPEDGSIYLYGKKFGLKPTDISLSLPGGFGYDKKKKFVYILEPCSLIITRYSTKTNGKLTEAKVIIDFKKYGYETGKFLPLGLEADSKGDLFTVSSLDGYLWHIDTTKFVATKVIKLPFGGLTSITFGGDNGNGEDLYITAANQDIDVFTGKPSPRKNPGTSLIKVSGLGKGTEFERLDICDF